MIHNRLYRNPYYDNKTLYKNICYKDNFDKRLDEEPFQLFIDPKKYYCSQVPGLKTNETCIVDNLARNPKVFCIIIEIVTYQRNYSIQMTYLLSKISTIINSNAKYSNLIKTFLPKFTRICGEHQIFSQKIDQIASSQSPDTVIQNITSFLVNKIDFMTQNQDFLAEVKKNESYLIDISLENTVKISSEIDRRTIYQKLKSFKKWLSFYIKAMNKMSALFPSDSINSRHLNETVKVLQCFFK